MATREGLTRRPGRQPREARPPGRPTPARVARGRSALSPPPAAGPAQPSAAQPGATRACLGPNLRSVSAAPAAAWRRPPRCCDQRPYRPLLIARQRHSRAHPFALLARARAPRSLGGGDDDMADTDQPRRSSTSWSRETNGGKSAARPATYVLSINTRTAKRHAIDVACALPAKQYGAVAHRVRAHHAPQAARCAAVARATRARGGGGRRRGATEAPIPLATPKMPQLRESLRNDLVPSPLPTLPPLWAPPLAPRGLPLLPLSIAPPAAPRRQRRPTARGRRRRGDRSHRHRSGRPGEERHVWGGRGGFAGEVVCVQLRQLLATNLPLDQRCGLTHLAQPTRVASPPRVHPPAQAAAARRRRRA